MKFSCQSRYQPNYFRARAYDFKEICIGQSFLNTCHTSTFRIPRYDGLDVVFYPTQNSPMSHVLAPLDTLSDIPRALCVASNQPIVLMVFTCSASWVALACCPSCNGAPDPEFLGPRRYVRRFAVPHCPIIAPRYRSSLCRLDPICRASAPLSTIDGLDFLAHFDDMVY